LKPSFVPGFILCEDDEEFYNIPRRHLYKSPLAPLSKEGKKRKIFALQNGIKRDQNMIAPRVLSQLINRHAT
jgi:hypothetical protein